MKKISFKFTLILLIVLTVVCGVIALSVERSSRARAASRARRCASGSRPASRTKSVSWARTSAVLGAYAAVLQRWSRRPAFTLNLTLLNRLDLHPDFRLLVGDFTSVSLLAVDDPGS